MLLVLLYELPLAEVRPLLLVALVLALLLVGGVLALVLVILAGGVLLLSSPLGALGDEVVRLPTLVALELVTSSAAQ